MFMYSVPCSHRCSSPAVFPQKKQQQNPPCSFFTVCAAAGPRASAFISHPFLFNAGKFIANICLDSSMSWLDFVVVVLVVLSFFPLCAELHQLGCMTDALGIATAKRPVNLCCADSSLSPTSVPSWPQVPVILVFMSKDQNDNTTQPIYCPEDLSLLLIRPTSPLLCSPSQSVHPSVPWHSKL